MFAHHFSHALKILVRTNHELHHVAFAEQLEILAKHLVFHARRRQLVVHRDTKLFWARSRKLRKRDRALLLPLGIVRDELGKVGRAIGLDLDHLNRFQTSKRMQQAVEIRLERGLAARDGHARYPFALHPVAELFDTHEFNGELRVARPLRVAVRAIQVAARKTDERRELTRVRAFAVDAHEALGYRKGTEYHIYLRFLCLLAAVDRAVVRGLVHVDLCDGQALFAQVIEEVARKILGSGAKRHDGEREAFVL